MKIEDDKIVIGSRVLLHPYWMVGTVVDLERTSLGIPLAIIDFPFKKGTRFFTDNTGNIVPYGRKFIIKNKRGDVVEESFIDEAYCIRKYNRKHFISFRFMSKFSVTLF